MEDIDTGITHPFGDLDSLLDFPRVFNSFNLFDQVRSRDSEEDGLLGREVITDRFDNLQQEPGAVLEGATIMVRTLVGQGRQEVVDEVAVGTMDLDSVHASTSSTGGSGTESVDDLLDLGEGELTRDAVVLIPLEVCASRGGNHILGPEG